MVALVSDFDHVCAKVCASVGVAGYDCHWLLVSAARAGIRAALDPFSATDLQQSNADFRTHIWCCTAKTKQRAQTEQYYL